MKLYALFSVMLICAACAMTFILCRQHFSRAEYRVLRVDEIAPDTAGYAWRGSADARVHAVVYTDVEFWQYYPMERMLDTLMNARGDKVRLYYKLLPLFPDDIYHMRTRAAYAALSQGKFFEMKSCIDTLTLPEEKDKRAKALEISIRACARTVSLDERLFARDIKARSVSDKFRRTIDETRAFGIHVFPCMLIGGRLIRGAVSAQKAIGIVDAAIAQSGDK